MGIGGVIRWTLALALIATAAPAATAAPIVERAGEVTVDFSAGVIEVRGVGAPGLRTPTAQIARVEGERAARADAGRRLVRGLGALGRARLGCDDAAKLPALDAAVQAAEAREIDWGSDGSVKLLLRVPVAALVKDAAAKPAASATPTPTPKSPDAGATTETGVDRSWIIYIDPKADGVLFESEGSCAAARPAPPLFATASDARAAGRTGETMKAAAKLPKARVAAVARSEK